MIRLSKTGIVYVTDHYNPNYEKYVKKEVKYLHPYLNERVELSADFTLGDLFKILEREKDAVEVVFSSYLGHYPLQLYIDDIKKPRPEDDDDDLDYLELKKYGELWLSHGDLELVIDFSGIGKKHEMGITYAIEFTPLSELKHLPLRLHEECEIFGIIIPSKLVRLLVRLLKKIHIPLGKLGRYGGCFSHTYVKGKVTFSVFEMLSEILCELSFVGSPEQRDDELQRLNDDVGEMKKNLGYDEED